MYMNATQRITRATVKSFIKKSGDKLHIRTRSSFDGMTDCVQSTGDRDFSKAIPAETETNYNLGVHGAWFVGSSRDYFSAFNAEGWTGIEVSNSCGSFILAVPA